MIVKSQNKSKLLNFIKSIFPCLKKWIERFSICIGEIIYTNLPIAMNTVEHEQIHVDRRAKWPKWLRWMWYVLYFTFPVPILFAYFRWVEERAAYLYEIKYYGRSIPSVVDTLWHNYCWTWPRPWMTRWFEKQMKEFNEANGI